jgi:endonuclease YncB( thermonuclease family)
MGTKRVWMLLAAVGFLVSGCTSSSQGEPPRQSQSPVASPSASGEWARIDPDALTVSKVLSGDTLRVKVDGDDVEVAIIGIKAPRVDAVDAVEQCLGKLSTAHLRDKEAGGGVRLFFDPSQSRTDDKGRRFAHVRLLATGTQAGAEQLRAGFAETIHRGDYHEQELNYFSDENDAKQGPGRDVGRASMQAPG